MKAGKQVWAGPHFTLFLEFRGKNLSGTELLRCLPSGVPPTLGGVWLVGKCKHGTGAELDFTRMFPGQEGEGLSRARGLHLAFPERPGQHPDTWKIIVLLGSSQSLQNTVTGLSFRLPGPWWVTLGTPSGEALQGTQPTQGLPEVSGSWYAQGLAPQFPDGSAVGWGGGLRPWGPWGWWKQGTWTPPRPRSARPVPSGPPGPRRGCTGL